MMSLVRFSQLIFILAGVILITGQEDWFPSYYHPDFMGAVSFLYAFFIELPAFFVSRPERRHFQISLAIGLLLSGLGSLGLWGLYERGIPYDKFVHFVFPALLTFSGIRLFQSWLGASFFKTTILIGSIIGFSGIAWEYVEYYFRYYFQIGFFGELFDRDSIIDIVINFIGIGAGILLLILKRNKRN